MPRLKKLAPVAPDIQAAPPALWAGPYVTVALEAAVKVGERVVMRAKLRHGHDTSISLKIQRDFTTEDRGVEESNELELVICRDDSAAAVKQLILWAFDKLPEMHAACLALETEPREAIEDPNAEAYLYSARASGAR